MVHIRLMRILRTIQECRDALHEQRGEGKRIAFVPTMGYLHAGHLELVRVGLSKADLVVASIFVNPTQFNDPRDLSAYPVDIEGDLRKLESCSTFGVFIPKAEEIYPPGVQTSVSPGALAEHFEGAFRPGHFKGVATVVTILFNIVTPDLAVFGEKDFQQLQVVRRLAKDLRINVEIVSAPTVREPDGLAMSSRNSRLGGDSRNRAALIYKSLQDLRSDFQGGNRDASSLIAKVLEPMQRNGIEVEYLSIVESETLTEVKNASSGNRVLVAGKVGGVRLIDNLEL